MEVEAKPVNNAVIEGILKRILFKLFLSIIYEHYQEYFLILLKEFLVTK